MLLRCRQGVHGDSIDKAAQQAGDNSDFWEKHLVLEHVGWRESSAWSGRNIVEGGLAVLWTGPDLVAGLFVASCP